MIVECLLPRGILAKVLLVVFTGVVAWAQVRDAATMFPSDAGDPVQAGGATLLESVCPGQVVTGREIACRTGCPEFTGFGSDGDHFAWSLSAVTRGHFLSPTSEDAALSMAGCEPHTENFGGTVLLTRRSRKWVMVWYKAGVEASQCHKMPLRDKRDILVCMGRSSAQGNEVTELYVEDLLTPAASLMAGEETAIFGAFDNTLTCGWNYEDEKKPFPLIRSHIGEVEFSTHNVNGASVISVTASLGRKAMTPADVDACMREQEGIFPATTSHRLEFMFDGRSYKVSPSTADAARLFENR